MVHDLIKALEEDFRRSRNESLILRARHYSSLIEVVAFMAVPLRAFNWSMMTVTQHLAWNEDKTKALVWEPYECAPGCTVCARACPPKAIVMPPRQILHQRVDAPAPGSATSSAALTPTWGDDCSDGCGGCTECG